MASGLENGIALAVERVVAWTSASELEPKPSICVMAHTNNSRDEIVRRLAQEGLVASLIDAETIDSASSTSIRVSTMHRAKGLEFDRVVVVAPGMLGDQNSDLPQLVYVSLTRAKSVAMQIK